MMNKQGFIHFILIIIFIIFPVVHSLVEIELSVLQFDNPLGTSYTGQNLNGARKCCDTGGNSCRNTSDTCDVYFTFCIGSLSHSSVAAGCKGTSVDMSKDVSHNVFKITDTRRLRAFTNVTSWVKGSTQFIVNVLDLDELQSPPNDPHVFPDLIDAFNEVVDFEPAQNFWSSEQHVISLLGHVSLDIGIRAWCANEFYGYSCENSCPADAIHTCSLDGTQLPHRECTDINTLVLSLNTTLPHLADKTTLKRNLIHFLADNICLKTTNRVNINIHDIRENRDRHIDVVFNAFCDNTTVSNLKFREILYVSDKITTDLDPPESYFISRVISPQIPYVKETSTEDTVVFLVRFVHYENKLCTSTENRCNPSFTISFPEIKTGTTLSTLNTNILTDCNGVYTDILRNHSAASSTKSTLLFVLKSYQNLVLIEVGDTRLNNALEKHNFSLSELVVGTNFRDSYPMILPTSTGAITKLTIEVMAWCSNCRQGDHCEGKVGNGCNETKTVLPPDCIKHSDCKHEGKCANWKCQCLDGWVGATCNTDIDECALGVCEHIASCTNTLGGYTCTCSTGFSGKNCEVDINECSTNPCKPGLECLNTYGSFACVGVCANNIVNPNCTGNINFCSVGPCKNNATCVNEPYNYTCICVNGWSGYKCQTNVNECTNSSSCRNGGTCTDTPGSFICQCSNTYTGPHCDIDVDECQYSETCRNDGTCVNTQGGFTCICPPSYTGKICDTDVDECHNKNVCINNGTCINMVGGYKCSCPPGYSGELCQQDIDECADSNSCNNNGTCANTFGGYTCACLPGYTGNSCTNDVNECLLKYCQHGQCSNFNRGYTCSCEDGWEGQNCSFDRHACSSVSPCLNGGTCINTPGSYTCNCTEYWQGEHCRDDVDECLTIGICHYHGNCSNTNGSFSCACYPGWTGVTCVDDINECLSSPCQNSGTCDNLEGGYSCICPSNWMGKNCDQDVNECNASSPCEHGGKCFNVKGTYNCTCTSNWTGSNCTDDVDECLQPDACSNGGSCVNTAGSYLCHCLPQWTGPRCEIVVNECQGQPCLNGGTCLNVSDGYSCSCTPAWTGQNCSDNVDECQLPARICVHGICYDTQGSYTCNCIKGYEGKNCDIDIDECSFSGICQHGGTCKNMNGSYACHCLEGWQGKNCTEDVNECLSQNPCHHSAVCRNINGSFTCLCQQGWTGKTCETDIDECVDTPCLHDGTCVNNNGSFTCSCASGWKGETCENKTDKCIVTTCKHGGTCHDLIHDFKCVCPIGYTGELCDGDIDDCASQPCYNRGTCHDHTGYYECICREGWNGTRCSDDVDECGNHSCGGGEACQNTPGSYMCVKKYFTAVSNGTSTSPSTKPFVVDVFSLEFVGPISDEIKPKIKEGIVGILKLLMCHDSTIIDVSLVQNSITVPNTVEFHAQCDGHHLTNDEVNDAIRTLSDDKLMQFFPIGLKNTHTPPEKQNWLLTHIPVVAGGAGGLLVLIIIIITVVCVKKRKAGIEENVQFSKDIVEPISDMDGQATITIRNPVYDSIYPHQTQI